MSPKILAGDNATLLTVTLHIVVIATVGVLVARLVTVTHASREVGLGTPVNAGGDRNGGRSVLTVGRSVLTVDRSVLTVDHGVGTCVVLRITSYACV